MARAFPASRDEEHKSLSQLLGELIARPEESLCIDEIVDHFGRRAFGAILFLFAAPNLLPLPPGSSTVLGLPLLLAAPQLMLGLPNLWLPRFVGRRRIRRQDMARVFGRVLGRLTRVERMLSPRAGWVFGRAGDRLIGLACTLLALVLVLPIWGGNMLPALTISTLALGLIQRDGLVVLIGYGFLAASAVALALGLKIVIAGAMKLLALFGA